jgi:CoA:oxalate CoA-transferase
MEKTLSGIKVLEMTQYYNGPYAGRLLGELGAEVIKVEPPWGDPQRHTPPILGDDSLHFIFYNANKKFITLNLKKEKGREIFLKLVERSDIFIENFTPGTLDKLNIGYEDQKRINPRIIYCSSTAYGEGPYRDYAGFDPAVESFSGLMDTNGFPDMPTRLGTSGLDLVTPVFADLAIVSALRYRDLHGEGQRIDIAMYDVAVLLSQQSMVNYFGGFPVRPGPTSYMISPEYLFKTRDGFVYVIIHTEKGWKEFVRHFGHSELLENEKFSTNASRVKNQGEVIKIVGSWLSDLSSREVVEIVTRVGGVTGEFREVSEQLDDPNTKYRNMYPEFLLSNGQKVRVPGSAFKMSKTPGTITNPGLKIGANNEEIYGAILGIGDSELMDLKEQGII